jgi:hypothetical protein
MGHQSFKPAYRVMEETFPVMFNFLGFVLTALSLVDRNPILAGIGLLTWFVLVIVLGFLAVREGVGKGRRTRWILRRLFAPHLLPPLEAGEENLPRPLVIVDDGIAMEPFKTLDYCSQSSSSSAGDHGKAPCSTACERVLALKAVPKVEMLRSVLSNADCLILVWSQKAGTSRKWEAIADEINDWASDFPSRPALMVVSDGYPANRPGALKWMVPFNASESSSGALVAEIYPRLLGRACVRTRSWQELAGRERIRFLLLTLLFVIGMGFSALLVKDVAAELEANLPQELCTSDEARAAFGNYLANQVTNAEEFTDPEGFLRVPGCTLAGANSSGGLCTTLDKVKTYTLRLIQGRVAYELVSSAAAAKVMLSIHKYTKPRDGYSVWAVVDSPDQPGNKYVAEILPFATKHVPFGCFKFYPDPAERRNSIAGCAIKERLTVVAALDETTQAYVLSAFDRDKKPSDVSGKCEFTENYVNKPATSEPSENVVKSMICTPIDYQKDYAACISSVHAELAQSPDAIGDVVDFATGLSGRLPLLDIVGLRSVAPRICSWRDEKKRTKKP